MQTETLLKELQQKGLISGEQNALISGYESTKAFSLHYELRTLLY